MDHYYDRIPGWFTWEALSRRMVAEAHLGAVFVEVGCWRGRSLCFLGVEALNAKKEIHLYAVDSWENANWTATETAAVKGASPREDFYRNIDPLGSVVTVLELPSVTAADFFADQSVDWVHIDGDHRYEAVRADITAWSPKIRPGGWLTGDDFTAKNPGVLHAVKELLPGYVIDGRQWVWRAPSS